MNQSRIVIAVSYWLFATTIALAQGYQFGVGDVVKVPFLGRETTGKIVSINHAGWYRVEVKHAGRTTVTVVTDPAEMKLVKKGDAPKPADVGMTPTHEQSSRTWTDQSGKFTLEAKLVQVVGNQVELESADGKLMRIRLDKLCSEDQAFVQANTAVAGADSTDESPIQSNVSGGTSTRT
jgi:hypothetical protein